MANWTVQPRKYEVQLIQRPENNDSVRVIDISTLKFTPHEIASWTIAGATAGAPASNDLECCSSSKFIAHQRSQI